MSRVAWVCAGLVTAACDSGSGGAGSGGAGSLSGAVKVDGSSTVAPILMAAAELFQQEHPDVRVTVGISGSGGGFKKFLDESPQLRTDINDASRPIADTEQQRATELGIGFIEIPIALDGIAVTVNPGNAFCDVLTITELKRIWEPGSEIVNWNQIRPGFPDRRLKLYGPGTDSGTFDYFVETVIGKAGACRSDYTASENDNVLVQGIAGDAGALGYFGFSYYESNRDKLKLLAIDNGDGKPVRPSFEIIRSGGYRPLSRPLLMYVNSDSAKRPEVRAFLDFLFDGAVDIVQHPSVNYVALPEETYALARSRLHDGVTGSEFSHGEFDASLSLAERYSRK